MTIMNRSTTEPKIDVCHGSNHQGTSYPNGYRHGCRYLWVAAIVCVAHKPISTVAFRSVVVALSLLQIFKEDISRCIDLSGRSGVGLFLRQACSRVLVWVKVLNQDLAVLRNDPGLCCLGASQVQLLQSPLDTLGHDLMMWWWSCAARRWALPVSNPGPRYGLG